jgi:hypothetical protein
MPFAVLAIDKSAPIDVLLQSYEEQDVLANAAAVVGEELHGRALVRTERLLRRQRPGQRGLANLDAAGAFQVSRRKIRDLSETELGARLGREIARLGAGRFTLPAEVSKPVFPRRRSRWRNLIGYW